MSELALDHRPAGRLPLPVVDGQTLSTALRAVLRPGELLTDGAGREHQLPRWFYQVDSWQTALDLQVTPNFALWEFIGVDVRETPLLRVFPRYVPMAVSALAAHLEVFRQAAGSCVHIAANGGYRSPAHLLTRAASRHCWAAAANIFRVGDIMLDGRDTIERYAVLARTVLPACWIRPHGPGVGEADDHLHLDLGYLLLEPGEAALTNVSGGGAERGWA